MHGLLTPLLEYSNGCATVERDGIGEPRMEARAQRETGGRDENVGRWRTIVVSDLLFSCVRPKPWIDMSRIAS